MTSSIINFDKKLELSGFTMEKTVRLMKLSLSRILLSYPEYDVTVDQWVILHMLSKHGKVSQQELGDLVFKDAPTVTRMIDLLVNKNLVLRVPDENDRRKFLIQLTSAGEEMYLAIYPLVKEFRADAYFGLSDDELHNLEKTLNKIFLNLSKQN